MKKTIAFCAVAALVLASSGIAQAAITYDANVTPGVIFGDGNANGSFTVDQNEGLELGLRGKLRHNASGAPENTFNSNGDGTYSFDAGVAPTQSFPTGVWSFEWSINSNFDGDGANLNDFTYVLGIDSDPTAATNFITFDPINVLYADHAIGDNATTEANNFIAADAAAYSGLIDNYNVAQNSWKPNWFIPPGVFDPTIDGTYSFYLEAFDGPTSLARTDIDIIVGEGGAPVPTPEPASMILWGLVAAGAGGVASRRRK